MVAIKGHFDGRSSSRTSRSTCPRTNACSFTSSPWTSASQTSAIGSAWAWPHRWTPRLDSHLTATYGNDRRLRSWSSIRLSFSRSTSTIRKQHGRLSNSPAMPASCAWAPWTEGGAVFNPHARHDFKTLDVTVVLP